MEYIVGIILIGTIIVVVATVIIDRQNYGDKKK